MCRLIKKISVEIFPSITLMECAKSFELGRYNNKLLDCTLKFNFDLMFEQKKDQNIIET